MNYRYCLLRINNNNNIKLASRSQHRALFSSSPLSNNNDTKSKIKYTPIVIVGGGPSGLLLSSLLSSSSTPSILLERKPLTELTTHPQAHFINIRTLEIMRHSTSSTLYDGIWKEMPGVSTWEYFRFGYSVLGQSFGNVLHDVRCSNGRSVVAMAGVHLSQNIFWKLLYDEALSYSDTASSVALESNTATLDTDPTSSLGEVHLSTNVDHIQYNKEDEMFHIQYSSSSTQDPEKQHTGTIKTKCIIGADGAHSKIRNHFSIKMKGNPSLQSLLNVHFQIKPFSILSQYLQHKDRVGMLHFVYNEKLLGVFVCHDCEKGEWVCQIPTFPPLQEDILDASKEEDVKTILLQGLLLGSNSDTKNDDDDIKKHWDSINICSIKPWNMSSTIADNYHISYPSTNSKSDCHVILIGDAAHTFPPAGGFGMNTGIQDVHNLFWRLSSWHNNNINNHNDNNKLFNVYEEERKQIATQNAELSLQNYQRTLRLVNIVFTSFDSYAFLDMSKVSNHIQQFIIQQIPSWMPLDMKQALFTSLLNVAMSSLRLLRNENGYSSRIIHLIQYVLRRGEGLPLLFPNYELGFSYASDKRELTNTTTHREQTNKKTFIPQEYIPKLEVGYRMPHCRMTIQPSIIAHTITIFPHLSIKDSDNTITLTDISHQLRNENTSSSPPFFACLVYSPFISITDNCNQGNMVIQHALDEILYLKKEYNISMNLVHILKQNEDGNYDTNREENDAMNKKDNYISVTDTHETFHELLPDQNNNKQENEHVIVILRPDGHIMKINYLSNSNEKEYDFMPERTASSDNNSILLKDFVLCMNNGFRC